MHLAVRRGELRVRYGFEEARIGIRHLANVQEYG